MTDTLMNDLKDAINGILLIHGYAELPGHHDIFNRLHYYRERENRKMNARPVGRPRKLNTKHRDETNSARFFANIPRATSFETLFTSHGYYYVFVGVLHQGENNFILAARLTSMGSFSGMDALTINNRSKPKPVIIDNDNHPMVDWPCSLPSIKQAVVINEPEETLSLYNDGLEQ